MSEILGIGLSHYPPLCGVDADMAGLLRATLVDDAIPAEHRNPRSWPDAMRAEWADDEGLSAAGVHRAALVAAFGELRRAIDDFEPDAIVIVGDDQYENFKEDLIPPFAVLAYDDIVCRPWGEAQSSAAMKDRANVWGEADDTEYIVRGDPGLGRAIATGLLERDIDVAYAYRPLHHRSLSHAFINALLFLDYDRSGFNYPIVPLTVNCYGSSVVSRKGFMAPFDDGAPPDPPSPSPERMMAVGRTLVEAIDDAGKRVALVASSSWSHAFLCDKTWRIRPDTASDRQLYEAMRAGDYDKIASRTVADLVDAGQHEVLNWYVLWGAMARRGVAPRWSTMVESDVFNSNKVFAIYPVVG